MFKSINCIIFLILSNYHFSQSNCSTLSNAPYDLSIFSRVPNIGNRTSLDIIPINVLILQDTLGGDNSVDSLLVQEAIDSVNKYLVKINLKAEISVYQEIKDPKSHKFYPVNVYIADVNYLHNYFKSCHVNIIIDREAGTGFGAGQAFQIGGPFHDTNYFYVASEHFDRNLFFHEFGHYFGLYHTFETYFGVELVNGSNCSVAGDFICDTEADPGLNQSDIDSLTCLWNNPGSIQDSNDDYYIPDTRNIMSYSPLHCLDSLSQGQFQVIRNTYDNNINFFNSCNTTFLKEEVLSNIKIYPNPTNKFLNIDFIGTIKPINIALYSSLGELFYRRTIYKQEQLQCENYPKGIYYLQISLEKEITIKKIIIQ